MPRLTLGAIALALAASLVVWLPGPAMAQPAGRPLYAFVSTADHLWLGEAFPLDSPATIEAFFDWLQGYGVKRVYWRGGQDQLWLKHYHFRPETPLFYSFWKKWRASLIARGIDRLAVEAAHRRGMEIYMVDGLFDHGAQGDAGGGGLFPMPAEDPMRLEHPEWAPMDRWGERIAPGPIEFCYPQARQETLARWLKLIEETGYDGLSLYTYLEYQSVAFPTEFGHNPPVLAEFRKRHAGPPESNPEVWAQVRGEFVTLLLEETHREFKARGKKLAIQLRPDQPDQPQLFLGGKSKVPAAGALRLDYPNWVRNGTVDELSVWFGVEPAEKQAQLQRLHASCGTGRVELTVGDSQPLDPRWDKIPGTVVASTLPGSGMDRYTLASTSADSLSSSDWRLRAQCLQDSVAGSVTLTARQVAECLKDPHVMVRRQAVLWLGARGTSEQVGCLELALKDPEDSVQTAAAYSLRALYGSQSSGAMLEACARNPNNFPLRETVITVLGQRLKQEETVLKAGLGHPAPVVREVCARVLAQDQASWPAMRQALAKESDPAVKFYALSGADQPEALEHLLQALKDSSPTVQLRAAKLIGDMAPRMAPQQSGPALAALDALFKQYGASSQRTDRSWGWRVVGNAILGFGQPGLQKLEAWRLQKSDPWLAWHAYLIRFMPADPYSVPTWSAEEEKQRHQNHAPTFPGWRQ